MRARKLARGKKQQQLLRDRERRVLSGRVEGVACSGAHYLDIHMPAERRTSACTISLQRC